MLLKDPEKGDLELTSAGGWRDMVVWSPYGDEKAEVHAETPVFDRFSIVFRSFSIVFRSFSIVFGRFLVVFGRFSSSFDAKRGRNVGQMGYKSFVCVESVAAEPIKLASGESWTATLSVVPK